VSALLRQVAFEIAQGEANRHVHEIGGNNHGPDVKKYLAEVGLPEGYSWCDAFVSWCFRKAAGKRVAWESAGVIVTYSYAKAHGWIVGRPFKYDLVLYDFDGDGQFDDHIGFVKRVLRLGPILVISTIEGNTESGQAGSQSDGGGVFPRTRTVRRSSAAFVRVPGRTAVKSPSVTARRRKLRSQVLASVAKRGWAATKKLAIWRAFKAVGGK
jgi:hypothetical protein